MADLDARQASAVEAGPVDLFIQAGAGSGKTRVLSTRFVSAVLGAHGYEACEPGELLAVTYTEKAAAELAERIRAALVHEGDPASARAVGDAWISTIHGMCSRILRSHALEAGIDPHYSILNEVEAGAVLAQATEDAVAEMLESAPEVEMLFDLYGYSAVIDAAHRACGTARSLGGRPDGIGTIDPGDCAERLRETAAALARCAEALAALRQTATVTGNHQTLSETAARIAKATSRGAIDADGLLDLLSSCGLRRVPSVDGHDALIGEARELIGEAARCAAQLAVAPYEHLFLELVSRIDARYAERKASRGALDFEDLQVLTATLLERDGEIAASYRERFSMLMLDEFQDTNALQLRILDAIAQGNLCTVGDENQSIYSFRHADVEVFRARARAVSDVRQLDINYRIAPPLLSVLNGLFSQPSLLGRQFMRLEPPSGDTPRRSAVMWPAGAPRFEARFIDAESPTDLGRREVEARCIADRVVELTEQGIRPEEIAVLMRAMSGGRATAVERALQERGVPVFLGSGGTFFDCPEVVEARALLGVIDNVNDDAALVVTLAGRLVGMSVDGLVALRTHAEALKDSQDTNRRPAHLWHALEDDAAELGPTDAASVGRLHAVVTEARRMRGVRPLSDTIVQALLGLDADLVMFASGVGGERSWSNLMKLTHMAAEYESATGGDLKGFLDYLGQREEHATNEQEATLDAGLGAVRVMSIHAAKGLEFPVVIVGGMGRAAATGAISVGAAAGALTLGMKLARQGESALETLGWKRIADAKRAIDNAERVRLLYVACTRAQEALTVIAPTDPGKEADGSLAGLFRQACEAESDSALSNEGTVYAAGDARIVLVVPLAASDAPLEEGQAPQAGSAARETVESDCPGEGSMVPESAAPGRQRHPAVPDRVSYTALATYGRCPYRFYLTSIARLPAPPAMQGGDALAFGSALHAVLERCASPACDVTALLAAAGRSARLDQTAVARLRSVVEQYLRSPLAAQVFEAERVMREAPIAVPLAGTILAGSIDVIAWRGTDALVVDYKSGATAMSDEDAMTSFRLQGQCYALAAFVAGATRVRVAFAEIERGRDTTYDYDQAERGMLEAEVGSMIARMASVGFPPRATYAADPCETCPGLGGMCPITRPSDGGAG